MLINLLKYPISLWLGKWKIDQEYISGTGAAPIVSQFFRLTGPIITPKFKKKFAITFSLILLTDRES